MFAGVVMLAEGKLAHNGHLVGVRVDGIIVLDAMSWCHLWRIVVLIQC